MWLAENDKYIYISCVCQSNYQTLMILLLLRYGKFYHIKLELNVRSFNKHWKKEKIGSLWVINIISFPTGIGPHHPLTLFIKFTMFPHTT